MVAGRGSDNPMLAHINRQQADLVAGAAELERAGVLQVLAFEQDFAAGQCRQPRAVTEGCDADGGAQCAVGFLNGRVQCIEVNGIGGSR